METEDIYGDLDDINLGEEITELKQKNASLTAQLKKREEDVYKLMKEITIILERERTLKENISELYKTASAELARKNRLIDELRGQVDDMVFRRGPRHQFEKKRTTTTGEQGPPSKRSCVESREGQESSLIIGQSETNVLASTMPSNKANSSSMDTSKQDDFSTRILRREEAVKSTHDQSSNYHKVRSKSKGGRRSRSPPRRSDSRSPPRRNRLRSPVRREKSRSSPRRAHSRSPRRRPNSRSPHRGRKRSRSPRRRTRDRRQSRYSPERSRHSSDHSQKNRSRHRTPDRRDSKDKDVIIVNDDRDVIFVKCDRDTSSSKILETRTTKTPIRRRRITAMKIADCTPDRELVKQKTEVVTVEENCSKLPACTSNMTKVEEKPGLSVNQEADGTSFLCGAEAARNEFAETYTKAEPQKNSNLFETNQLVGPESSRPGFSKFLDNLVRANKPTKPGVGWPVQLIEIDNVCKPTVAASPSGKLEQYSSGIANSTRTNQFLDCLSSTEIEYSSAGLITKVDQLSQLVKNTVNVPVVFQKFCESPAGSNESDGDFSGKLMIDEQPQEDFLGKTKTVDSQVEQFEEHANKPPENERDRNSSGKSEGLKESPGQLQPGRRGRRICKRIRISDDDVAGSEEDGVKTKENQQPQSDQDFFDKNGKIEKADQTENILLEIVEKHDKSAEKQLQSQSIPTKVAAVKSSTHLKELEGSNILRELLESNQTGSKIGNKTAKTGKKEVKARKSPKQPSSKKSVSRVKNVIKIKVAQNIKIKERCFKKTNVKEERKKQLKSTRKLGRKKFEENNSEKPEDGASKEENLLSNCKISSQPEESPKDTDKEKEDNEKSYKDIQNLSKSITISKSSNCTRKVDEKKSIEIDSTRCEESQSSKHTSEVEKDETDDTKCSKQPDEVLINPITKEVREEHKNEQVTAVTEPSEQVKIEETEEKSQQLRKQVEASGGGSRKRSPCLKEIVEDKINSNKVLKLSTNNECSSEVIKTESEIKQQPTMVQSLEVIKTHENIDSEATETKVLEFEKEAENKLQLAKTTSEPTDRIKETQNVPLNHIPKKFEVCHKAHSKRTRRLVSIAQERDQKDLPIDKPLEVEVILEKADNSYHTAYEQFLRMKNDSTSKLDSEVEEASKSCLVPVGSEQKGKQQEMSVHEIEEDIVKSRRDFLLSVIEMDEDTSKGESQEITLEKKGVASIKIKEEGLGLQTGTLGIRKEALGVQEQALDFNKKAFGGVKNVFGKKQEALRIEKDVKKDLVVEKEATIVKNDLESKKQGLSVEKQVSGDLKPKMEDLAVQRELLGVIKELRSKKKGRTVVKEVCMTQVGLSVEKNIFAAKEKVVGDTKKAVGVLKTAAEVKQTGTDTNFNTIKPVAGATCAIDFVTTPSAISSQTGEVSDIAATKETKTDSTVKTINHNVTPKKRITPIKIDISLNKSPSKNFEEARNGSENDVFGTTRPGLCMPDLFGSPSKAEDFEATKPVTTEDINSTNYSKLIQALSGEQKGALHSSQVSSSSESLAINANVSVLTNANNSGLGLQKSECDTSGIEDRLKAMDSLESSNTPVAFPAITSTADLQNLLSETPNERRIVSKVSCSSGRRRRCIVKMSDD